ncbi:hypothetical protein [Chitinophaga lutea]|uniref:hypothetical protein n=1 Tax=Chitinophaga lutea TaxID=2488634 RepID=UPI000F4F5F11|nr:hypothetical protein [Chitinophaga lutea]
MKNPDRYPVIVIQRKHKPHKRICQFGKSNDRKGKKEKGTNAPARLARLFSDRPVYVNENTEAVAGTRPQDFKRCGA